MKTLLTLQVYCIFTQLGESKQRIGTSSKTARISNQKKLLKKHGIIIFFRYVFQDKNQVKNARIFHRLKHPERITSSLLLQPHKKHGTNKHFLMHKIIGMKHNKKMMNLYKTRNVLTSQCERSNLNRY